MWEVISRPHGGSIVVDGAELSKFHDDGSFDGTLVDEVQRRSGCGSVRRMSLDLDEPAREGRLSAPRTGRAGRDPGPPRTPPLQSPKRTRPAEPEYMWPVR